MRGVVTAAKAVLLGVAFSLGTALHQAQAQPTEPLKVVATFSILADMVQNVGGPLVQVSSLVGPQADAHGFEPRPRDVKAVAQAQVIVANGLGFETWLPGLQQAAGFKGRTVLASDGSLLIQADASTQQGAGHAHHDDHADDHKHDDHKHDDHKGEGHQDDGHKHDEHGHDDRDDHAHDAGHEGHDHGPIDPHAWQDIRNGIHYVHTIAKGLGQADPANAQQYLRRANEYVQQLQTLDADLRAQLAKVPVQNRKVISSHDAFAYFSKAYGVQFIPVAGLSGRSEASAKAVAELVDRVRSEKIAGIFVESGASSRMVEQLARETGAKVGGELYSDALAAPGKPADTYLGMMRWNAEQLLGVLQP